MAESLPLQFWKALFESAKQAARTEAADSFPYIFFHKSAAARKLASVLRSFPKTEWELLGELMVLSTFTKILDVDPRTHLAGSSNLLTQLNLRQQCVPKKRLDELAQCPSSFIDIPDKQVLDASHRLVNLPLARRAAIRKALLNKLEEKGHCENPKSREIVEIEVPHEHYQFTMILDFGGWMQLRIDARVQRNGVMLLSPISYAALLGYPLSGWDEITTKNLEGCVESAIREYEQLQAMVSGALRQVAGST